MNIQNPKTISTPLQNETDIQDMRELVNQFPCRAGSLDLEESLSVRSVRATTRLWRVDGRLIGFAFVDDFNNLRFEIDLQSSSEQLQNEIIAWGVSCLRDRNTKSGQDNTLDASFSAYDIWQIEMLEKHGFKRERVLTLRYSRSLDKDLPVHALPAGFSVRFVKGEQEVQALVDLHRAAFGTKKMTFEKRLAIMHAPGYEQELDLVVTAPNGELGGFCICELDKEDQTIGYTDPVGTHPRCQHLGLGSAIITAGMMALKNRGARVVELGTSSGNTAMQRLAEKLGFVVASEKLWFSKQVS